MSEGLDARIEAKLPELVAYELTGAAVAERTNAGTVGLLDVDTGSWASDLARAVALDSAILPPVAPGGRLPGQHDGVPVHLVAAHDTACAVAASPLEDGAPRAFLSGGTWFLVGIERAHADTSDAARKANVSNEPGAPGGYRFLKKVTGLWLLEQCLAGWDDTSVADLVEGAASVPQDTVRLFDVQDPRFLAPEHIEDEVVLRPGWHETLPQTCCDLRRGQQGPDGGDGPRDARGGTAGGIPGD